MRNLSDFSSDHLTSCEIVAPQSRRRQLSRKYVKHALLATSCSFLLKGVKISGWYIFRICAAVSLPEKMNCPPKKHKKHGNCASISDPPKWAVLEHFQHYQYYYLTIFENSRNSFFPNLCDIVARKLPATFKRKPQLVGNYLLGKMT